MGAKFLVGVAINLVGSILINLGTVRGAHTCSACARSCPKHSQSAGSSQASALTTTHACNHTQHTHTECHETGPQQARGAAGP